MHSFAVGTIKITRKPFTTIVKKAIVNKEQNYQIIIWVWELNFVNQFLKIAETFENQDNFSGECGTKTFIFIGMILVKTTFDNQPEAVKTSQKCLWSIDELTVMVRLKITSEIKKRNCLNFSSVKHSKDSHKDFPFFENLSDLSCSNRRFLLEFSSN